MHPRPETAREPVEGRTHRFVVIVAGDPQHITVTVPDGTNPVAEAVKTLEQQGLIDPHAEEIHICKADCTTTWRRGWLTDQVDVAAMAREDMLARLREEIFTERAELLGRLDEIRQAVAPFAAQAANVHQSQIDQLRRVLAKPLPVSRARFSDGPGF